MKIPFLTFSLVGLCLVGCSGSGTTTATDGGTEAAAPTTTIACGGTPCDVTTNACCIGGGGGGTPTFACTATCAATAVAVHCKSNADCGGGQSCCIEHGTSGALATSCKAGSCGGAIVCSPSAAETANRCGDAGACGTTNVSLWSLPAASYGTCGDVGD